MSDLARMHTAEHLLSAVMRKHYAASRNIEFHLNAKKTKCDYPVSRPLSDNDMREIERLVNEQIQAGHAVTTSVRFRDDCHEFDLWKVPADITDVRIVRIGDYDAQPCRGEHVSVTSEIGVFQIASFEMRETNRVRIRFTLR